MQWRSILLVSLAGLCGCGDEPPIPNIAPAREMTAAEKKAAARMTPAERAAATRPAPLAMRRERDPKTGISIGFPTTWRVDRPATALFQAWADKAGPSGDHYVEHITVTHFELPGVSLDEHLATMRENTPAVRPGLKEVVSGARRIGSRDARLFRYTLPWTEGRISEEVTILKQGAHFCVVVGSCHVGDRATFASTYSIILHGVRWQPPAPKK